MPKLQYCHVNNTSEQIDMSKQCKNSSGLLMEQSLCYENFTVERPSYVICWAVTTTTCRKECVCVFQLVTTFPEWLSSTEPLSHTPGAVHPSLLFVVFCVHMYSFAGLIRRTPPLTFSDTAITDCHSDTTIFQLRAH